MRAIIRYVKKDNVFIEYGKCPSKYADEVDRKAILEELATKSSEAKAMEFIYINGHARESYLLLQFWKTKQGEQTSGSRFNVTSFLECRSLLAILQELDELDRCLLLIGPSGWGKTQFLLAYYAEKIVIRATHMDDLRKVTLGTQVLILDDLSFGHLPRSTLLHLFDKKTVRSVHVRYTVANLHAKLNVIIVGNGLDLVLGNYVDDEAVVRRLEPFTLPHRLWD